MYVKENGIPRLDENAITPSIWFDCFKLFIKITGGSFYK
jgi:hypothetical protein